MAEWLCKGLQILLSRFDSGRDLHYLRLAIPSPQTGASPSAIRSFGRHAMAPFRPVQSCLALGFGVSISLLGPPHLVEAIHDASASSAALAPVSCFGTAAAPPDDRVPGSARSTGPRLQARRPARRRRRDLFGIRRPTARHRHGGNPGFAQRRIRASPRSNGRLETRLRNVTVLGWRPSPFRAIIAGHHPAIFRSNMPWEGIVVTGGVGSVCPTSAADGRKSTTGPESVNDDRPGRVPPASSYWPA